MSASIKNVILVLSGKGGVGKSTISTQIALGLKDAGHKVGLLDIDLCGPSIPKMLHLEGHDIHQCPEGWVPVYVDSEQRLSVMSIGFLLKDENDAVVWRGPKKNGMIKQFLNDVFWGELDYLVVDTPPGTSDEHITVVENMKEFENKGAVLVTTPQAVAVGDVRREVTFCKKTGIPILGIVENMSGFVCPHCAECSYVFSRGGGTALAEQTSVPFLGCVAIDPNLTQCLEQGQNYMEIYKDSPTRKGIQEIVDKVTNKV